MPELFDKDGRGASGRTLVIRGLVFAVIIGVAVGGVMLKSSGTFDSKVELVAVLDEMGDGLPPRSDVKFHGLLIGTVGEVTPSTGQDPSRVVLRIDPQYADGIPESVTARVVPSNLFAVSSVQLVDNGQAPAILPGSEIPQDRSLSTVQLQTALTKLRDIIGATARIATSDTVGVLASVAKATDRRGDDIVRAGAQLDRITEEFGALVAPPGQPSTLHALSDAVSGLSAASPDLLDVLHHAVGPMRAAAEHKGELFHLLSAGSNTMSTLGGGMNDHTDQLVGATDQLTPVLDVFGDGAGNFEQMSVSIRKLSDQWFAEFWNPETQSGTGKFQIRMTPDTPYTREDCPRYGELAGASCRTAPVEPTVPPLPESMKPPPPAPIPGIEPQARDLIGRVLGGEANSAERVLSELLTNRPPDNGGGR